MRSTRWKSFEHASVSAERSTLCLVHLFYHLAPEESCLKNWKNSNFRFDGDWRDPNRSCRSSDGRKSVHACLTDTLILGRKRQHPASQSVDIVRRLNLGEMLTNSIRKLDRNVNETHWKNLAEMLTKPIRKLGRNVNQLHSKYTCFVYLRFSWISHERFNIFQFFFQET